MQRREYMMTTAAAAVLAGCLSTDHRSAVDDEPATNSAHGSTSHADISGDEHSCTPRKRDDELQSGDDGFDGSADDAGNPTSGAVGVVPDAAIHQWSLAAPTRARYEDAIGDADGIAYPTVDTVEGDWLGGAAAALRDGREGYIDLGRVNSIDDAAAGGNITLLATVKPVHIERERSMTILGAGGGETDWLEFRLSDSDGTRNGRPMLVVRDSRGNSVSAAAMPAIEIGTIARIACRFDGTSSEDIEFWIDGKPVDVEVIGEGVLAGEVSPAGSYGIFASNPREPGTIGTRRWLWGTIDNVICCHAGVRGEEFEEDYHTQPWVTNP